MEFAIFPRWALSKIAGDRQKQIHWNLLLTNLMIGCVLGIVSHHRSIVDVIPGVCLFQTWLSIPCPGCGVTTSLLAFAGGNFGAAWSANPAGAVLFGFIWLQVPLRMLALLDDRAAVQVSTASKLFSKAILLGMITIWLARIL